MISQMTALIANVDASTPRSAQGEIEAKPKPEPRATNMRLTDTATNAPAKIAPHEAADFGLAELNTEPVSSTRGLVVVCMVLRRV